MRFKFLFLLLPFSVCASPGYFEPWGKDADLRTPVELYPARSLGIVPQQKHSLAVRLAEKVIRFRQQVLSPTDGPRSHFRPTSSQYMLDAVRKYGFLEGYLMGCDRLMRENSDDWVYRKIESEGQIMKYDPVR